MKIVNIVGKMARDILVASAALVVAKASEVGAKEAWHKISEMKSQYDKKKRPLASYKGVVTNEEGAKVLNETK